MSEREPLHAVAAVAASAAGDRSDPNVPGDEGDPSEAPDPTLAAAIAQLPPELDPGRDLWPPTRRAIRRRGRRRVIARGALAAAAVLALAVAVWRLAPSGPSPAPLGGNGLAADLPTTTGPRLAAYSEGDRALTEIRDQLVREIEAKQDRLPAETRALVFENLRTIDRALAEIESALESAPGDAELGRTYLSYRERQIGLLRQANRAASRL